MKKEEDILTTETTGKEEKTASMEKKEENILEPPISRIRRKSIFTAKTQRTQRKAAQEKKTLGTADAVLRLDRGSIQVHRDYFVGAPGFSSRRKKKRENPAASVLGRIPPRICSVCHGADNIHRLKLS